MLPCNTIVQFSATSSTPASHRRCGVLSISGIRTTVDHHSKVVSSKRELVHLNNYLIKIHISYSWHVLLLVHLLCDIVLTILCTSHH